MYSWTCLLCGASYRRPAFPHVVSEEKVKGQSTVHPKAAAVASRGLRGKGATQGREKCPAVITAFSEEATASNLARKFQMKEGEREQQERQLGFLNHHSIQLLGALRQPGRGQVYLLSAARSVGGSDRSTRAAGSAAAPVPGEIQTWWATWTPKPE